MAEEAVLGLAARCGSRRRSSLLLFKKRERGDAEDAERSEDAFEDEDFDLDSDLKSASDREYVPLTPGKAESSQEQQPQEETPGKKPTKRSQKRE